ncbi:MAG: RND family efflux transporter MFP subunit [Paracoccaceae bacterium]|jgi:RND family efflux transporter MFP subunit
MSGGFSTGLFRAGLLSVGIALTAGFVVPGASAQGTELSDRGKAADKNKNGVIDRNEAGGPLKSNFDDMDCNKSGTLDGAEISGFFTGVECPKPAAAAPAATPVMANKSVPPLSDRGRAADKNKNGVIGRDEAGGPLKSNFDDMDCNKSGTLDGGEIKGFFTGEECPKPVAGTPATGAAPKTAAKPSAAPGKKAGGPRARAVRVDAVIVEPKSQTYPVIGRLVAQRTGNVAARINGAVVEMNVNVGDRVKKGDILAVLAIERLTAQRDKYAAALSTRRAMVQTAQAEASKTAQELRRMSNLKTSSAFSRARYEDLQRDVDARQATLVERRSQQKEAQAELDQVAIDLNNGRIRAPYDGVVSEKHTEIGSYVNVGNPVVTLISDTEIEVEAEVPSDRIAGLTTGRVVRFRLDDGTDHRAIVRSIIPRENARTRTRPVRFTPTFGEKSSRFAINQSVTVLVPIGKIQEVVTVHKDAIVHRGPNRVVSIVRKGKAFPRQVTLGVAVGNRYIVEKGLKAGDVVVTHGNETLPPGAQVRILTGGSPRANGEKTQTN